MLVTTDGRQCLIRQLTYQSTSLGLARGLSTLYVSQLDALCQSVIDAYALLTPAPATTIAVDELDRVLSSSLADSESDVPVHVYEDLFGIYRMQALPLSKGTVQCLLTFN